MKGERQFPKSAEGVPQPAPTLGISRRTASGTVLRRIVTAD